MLKLFLLNHLSSPRLSRKLSACALMVSLAVILTACGSSGGGGGGSQTSNPPDPAPIGASFSVSGTATKGTIIAGIINVYVAADLETPVFTAPDLTDGSGAYTLTIPASSEFAGELVVVEVAAAEDGSSSMICDSNPATGCSAGGVQVAFGESIGLPAGFSLRGVVTAPAEGGSAEVHLNPFAHLVYEIAGGSGSTLDAATVEEAGQQLARLFNFGSGDFTGIVGIDVSDAAALEAATAQQARLAVFSGALLTAALADDPADLNTALAGVLDAVLAALNALNQDPGATDEVAPLLASILDDAQSLSAIVGLGDLAAELLGELAQAELGNVPDITDPTPSPGEGLTGLEQAKQFVSDLRNIDAAFRQNELESDFTPLENAIDLAADVASDGADDALNALVDVLEAVLAAAEAYHADATLTSFTSDLGIEVAITPGPDDRNATFVVDAVERFYPSSGVNTVSVEAVVENASGDGQIGDDEFTATGDLSLTGSVDNAAVSLLITDGDAEVVALDVNRTTEEKSVSEITLRLIVDLAQKASADVPAPVSFTGFIRGSAIGVSEDDSGLTFGRLDLSLAGLVASAEDEVEISVSVVQDGAGYILGELPLGTVLEAGMTYTVENSGNLVTMELAGFESENPVEVTFVAELAGGTMTFSFTDDEGELFASFSVPSDFSLDTGASGAPAASALAYLNQNTRFFFDFLFEDAGLFVPDEADLPLSDSGGTVDFLLDCIGFCVVRAGTVDEFFAFIEADSFPNNRLQVIRGSFAVSLTTNVVGIGDTEGVEISVSGTKTSLTGGHATAALRYSGREIVINRVDLDWDNLDALDSLTIVNQDGITIFIEELPNDELSGRIFRGEEEFATISEDGDLLLFRYEDGTFESI